MRREGRGRRRALRRGHVKGGAGNVVRGLSVWWGGGGGQRLTQRCCAGIQPLISGPFNESRPPP